MPIGPGVYDDLCTYVREQAHAQGVILIVLNGDRGVGFSVQAPPAVMPTLGDLLRHLADDIDAQMKDGRRR